MISPGKKLSPKDHMFINGKEVKGTSVRFKYNSNNEQQFNEQLEYQNSFVPP